MYNPHDLSFTTTISRHCHMWVDLKYGSLLAQKGNIQNIGYRRKLTIFMGHFWPKNGHPPKQLKENLKQSIFGTMFMSLFGSHILDQPSYMYIYIDIWLFVKMT